MSQSDAHLYEFGPFRLDLSERQLFRDGKPVSLTPKDFETLVLLVSRRGHVVEKDDLLKEVWKDSFVEEANISRHIWTLRQTLGENENGQSPNGPTSQSCTRRAFKIVPASTSAAVTSTENHSNPGIGDTIPTPPAR